MSTHCHIAKLVSPPESTLLTLPWFTQRELIHQHKVTGQKTWLTSHTERGNSSPGRVWPHPAVSCSSTSSG